MNTNIVRSLLLILTTTTYILPAADSESYSSTSESTDTFSEEKEQGPINISERLTSPHAAVRNNNAVGIVILAINGANLNEKNKHGETPLHEAARLGHVHCLARLLQLKADINAQDNYRKTPLHLAIIWNHKECVSTLMAQGALLDVQDHRGFTPLHCAAQTGSLEIFTELLLAGADQNICTIHGATIEDIAQQYLQPHIVSYLKTDEPLNSFSDHKSVTFEKNIKRIKRKEK